MTRIKPICLVDSVIKLSSYDRDQLEGLFDVHFFGSQLPDKTQLRKCDVLLVHSRISDELIKCLDNCKYIGVRAHNTDYINSELARDMNIIVKGIPQVGQTSVAEHTFALIFAITKQLKMSHANIMNGKWKGQQKPNYELQGKKLGIIGYGEIGKQVGMIGRALGMEILVANKPGKHEDSALPLEDVVKESDIITLHLSNKDNKVFFDQAKIDMMKTSAILINTSRGSLLDYAALQNSLSNGRLFGAGLDVFPEEPLQETTICSLDNVFCTPHQAYFTEETLSLMNKHLIDNVRSFHLNNDA
ncbi:2-hydroxyacid dehydrogenase [Cohnella abietis]|uniref:Glycerate dehydrogenase n=1 Tax=Cohnella abietis TaxID=2507935 RepID=A0A3T1D650_9BACL|nr:NAD(P)-dependent oxidoreductase [Cohnella abietis]BBI33553.1 glycerate dehydrogenase [Cohnella abietis]